VGVNFSSYFLSMPFQHFRRYVIIIFPVLDMAPSSGACDQYSACIRRCVFLLEFNLNNYLVK